MKKNIFSSQTLLSFLALVTSATILGCSDRPSSKTAEKELRQRIDIESQKRISLTQFKKTDGQSADPLGYEIYSLEYEAEIKFVEDCLWSQGHFGLRFATSPPRTNPDDLNDMGNYLGYISGGPSNLMKKGERRKFTGAIEYEKTEKGWRNASWDVPQN